MTARKLLRGLADGMASARGDDPRRAGSGASQTEVALRRLAARLDDLEELGRSEDETDVLHKVYAAILARLDADL
jgi:hypothetical protein